MTSLAELKPGDYMVHLDFGVGVYRGLNHYSPGGRGTSSCWNTPAGTSSTSRWTGSTWCSAMSARRVSSRGLDRLGGAAWDKAKAKAREAVQEMAEELLKIYAAREVNEGFHFSPPDDLYREFEAAFAFEETPDQVSPSRMCCATWRAPARWTGWSAATSATARPRSPCAPPSRRSWTASRWRCWSRPPCLPSSTWRPSHARFEDYPVRVEMLSRFRTAARSRR